MKKYKLIKQYKGSPELGIIVTVNNDGTIQVPIGSIGTLIHGKPSDYSQYWEEIIEEDYEILSYENYITGQIMIIGQTFLTNEGYRKFSEFDLDKTNSIRTKRIYSIYSVKRLSDGEIFSVGDKVYSKFTKSINSWKNCFVHAFIIKNNKIKFQIIENETKGIYTLEEIQHYKKPLFTTEDGVDIYHGETHYIIKNNSFVISLKADKNHSYSSIDKKFSTFEKAEEYILYNKKSLSLNDLIDNKDHHMSASTLIKKCEKLIRNNK